MVRRSSRSRWSRRTRSRSEKADVYQRRRRSAEVVRHSRKRRMESDEDETPAGSGGGGTRRPNALFLMGLPGAGKTTVKRRRLHSGDLDIEPDRFKKRHPRYSENMGEETDDEVHRWSVRRSVDAFEQAVHSSRKPNIVYDSSGSNARWMEGRIATARRAGYTTELLWVDVPVEVALLRNRDRARHGQWCPEKIIQQKASVLSASFDRLRKEVDSTERLENWSQRSGERARAELDLYFYPAPRRRPLYVRPGDDQYGEMPPGARSPSPTRGSRRTIRIGPWKRNEEVARAKSQRLAWMDRTFRGDRELYVREEVLGSHAVLLEQNLFPYHVPPGIEHWTIWSRESMGHSELCEYVEGWLDAREPHNVASWNYDDNRGRRTIDVWHVHLYFQGREGYTGPLLGRSGGKGAERSSARSSKAGTPPPTTHSCQHRSPCSV